MLLKKKRSIAERELGSGRQIIIYTRCNLSPTPGSNAAVCGCLFYHECY